MKSESEIKPVLFDTYLPAINGSLGSKMFRNAYAFVDRKKKDILNDGELSCAFFVSFILSSFGLCDSLHATVNGIEKDMLNSKWKEIKKLKKGSVIMWEEYLDDNGEMHKHAGFYIGGGKAISNSFHDKTPAVHDKDFDGSRIVESIYWSDVLDGE